MYKITNAFTSIDVHNVTYVTYVLRSLTNKKKNATRKKHKVEEDVRTSSLDGRPLLVSGQLEQRLVEIRTAQNFNEQCDQCMYI